MNAPKPLPERLVLKVALPEAALAPSKRRKFGPGQWKKSSLLTCLHEFEALDAFAKLPWVLDSYGWGMVQLASGEEMPCLLLEYAPWGTLEDQLVGEDGQPQGLAPEVCRMVVDYVVQCLLPSESMGVYIHRDIKPANIMLCNPSAGMKASPLAPWVPKLGDTGISRKLSMYRWLSTTVA
jgi:serine/threonine protein kinase